MTIRTAKLALGASMIAGVMVLIFTWVAILATIMPDTARIP